MTYRPKKESETWNEYLIKVFREKKGVNFMHFCDKYFNEERTLEYQEGREKEKKEEKQKINKEKKVKKETDTAKTSFAKKPDRLKKKKGFLF